MTFISIKSFVYFPWKYKWATISIAILLSYCFYMSYLGEIQTKRLVCQGRLYYWGSVLENYYGDHRLYPDFKDSEGNALLSWRVALLQDDSRKFRYDETWISEYNTAVIHQIEKGKGYYDSFTCHSLKNTNTNAAYVALTGKGTAWTEINEGRKRADECKDMILILEIPNPKNHWAEPNDDVSAEDVIQLYKEYKTQTKKMFIGKYHPNRFFVVEGYGDSFANIETVEELKRRLVIQEE